MGYRSDVSILIYGDDADVVAFKASERLKGWKGTDRHPLDEPTNNNYHERFTWHTNDGDTMLEFNWFGIKWYDTYPEIAYWEQLKSLFEQAFPSLHMEFARIGEQADDIVTEYLGNDCQYYLAIERNIYKDIPTKEKIQDEYLTKYNS